jgi:hypothetical protein
MVYFTPLCSVDVGEVFGLYYVIRWIHELRLANVDFDLDLKKMIDYFNKSSGRIMEFNVVMEACKRNCRLFF